MRQLAEIKKEPIAENFEKEVVRFSKQKKTKVHT